MKVVHFESGLGNQMLAYAEYLAIKQENPDEECYIETIIYDIPEAEQTIKQWNGYELEKIFGLTLTNISELFTTSQWQNVMEDVRDSQFWKHNWSYPDAISNALNTHGNLYLNKLCKSNHKDSYDDRPFWRRKLSAFLATDLGYNLKRNYLRLFPQIMIKRVAHPEKLFFSSSADDYCGFTLLFKYRNNFIERIDRELREAFVFPTIDAPNQEVLLKIQSSESVAVHIRRGDMLNITRKYYTGGYFKRAIRYIRKQVKNPIFFVFCDPDSVDWTKNNYDMLGFNKDDEICFVSWNSGENSFRDMQLISNCKHAIVTGSSFGWWGAYLIDNPDKITITPDIEINSTYHC